MLLALLLMAVALAVSLITTPLARKVAIRFKIYALQNHRTVHTELVPKMGGVSVYTAFVMGLVVCSYWGHAIPETVALLLGGTIVLLVGLTDDVFNLTCSRKLLGQLSAAMVAVVLEYRIEMVQIPLLGVIDLGPMAVPVSVLWVIGITNALNLLDGLDGLAVGFSIIISLFLLMAGSLTHNPMLATVCLILVGACLGFLRYNYIPASIFMGDSGSLFLGLVLACLSIKMFTPVGGPTHVAPLLALFWIPIADTSLSVWRRMKSGRHPFLADKKHIHHRLLEKGLTQNSAVGLIYAITAASGLFALMLFVFEGLIMVLLAGLGILICTGGLVKLGCFDFFTVQKRSIPRRVESVTFENDARNLQTVPQQAE